MDIIINLEMVVTQEGEKSPLFFMPEAFPHIDYD